MTSDNPSLLSHLFKRLEAEFARKDLGPLHYFLGIEVIPFKDRIFLSQSKYALDLLTKTNMHNSKPIGSPLAPKHNLHNIATTSVDGTPYRSVVGALQYLTLNTS